MRATYLLLLSVAVFCLQHTWTQPVDLRQQVVYLVMIDRFHNGDASNDFRVERDNPQGFHGGDIAGLLQKLDYLQDLGITTVYLTPLFDNRDDTFFGQFGYHGYWVKDFYQTEEHFADLALLQKLTHNLANRKMHLILDMVVNHVDYNSPLVAAHPDWFHSHPEIKDWNDTFQLENYKLHGLPDLAHEKQEVQDFLLESSLYWLGTLRPIGFRLDGVKHVPLAFWKQYNQSIRQHAGADFFLLGEYFHGDIAHCSHVLNDGNFSSLFDYPLYYTLEAVIAGGQNAQKLGLLFAQDRLYRDASLLATFIDNQDVERFITRCRGDVGKYRQALGMLLTVRGVPTLYYGSESGLPGGQEPDNRRDMVFTHNELFSHCQKLIATRRASSALSQGIQMHLDQSRDTYAFARIAADDVAVVVLHTGSGRPLAVPLFSLAGPLAGRTANDAVQGLSATVSDGRLTFTCAAQSFYIFRFPAPAAGAYARLAADYRTMIANPPMVPVTFRLRCQKPPQTDLYVIGNPSSLGAWNPRAAAGPLQQLAADVYAITILLPAGSVAEYKYIQQPKEGSTVWELCLANRYLQVPWDGAVTHESSWDQE